MARGCVVCSVTAATNEVEGGYVEARLLCGRHRSFADPRSFNAHLMTICLLSLARGPPTASDMRFPAEARAFHAHLVTMCVSRRHAYLRLRSDLFHSSQRMWSQSRRQLQPNRDLTTANHRHHALTGKRTYICISGGVHRREGLDASAARAE